MVASGELRPVKKVICLPLLSSVSGLDTLRSELVLRDEKSFEQSAPC